MKKIININLAGRVVPIEDSAYESLQRYIESLRRYFANEEGRDEIINDIESRIAELMNDKVRRGAHAITDADVEEIIHSMGRVEDFEESDRTTETETAGASTQAAGAGTAYTGPNFTRPKGRLYRNLNDKFLGGVCSGVANYLNLDPSVVRLLFAIITFGGFGFGFLLYIVLWIVLPAQELDTFSGKRLYRNPEDRVIGGVAGGLAAYFNRSASTIRLIFAAPLILNIFFSLLHGIFSVWRFSYSPVDIAFGSITSTFILVYIVLWIVLPEARSQFEKMEMRGEKIDVNSIRQNVQEGMGDFKTRMQNWGEEVKDSAQRLSEKAKVFAETRGKTFASEAGQAARPVASGIGHAIGVLFKAFFIFLAGSIAFGLFVGLMVLIFGGGAAIWPLKEALLDFVLNGFWQKVFFWGTLIFFIAVPLIAFMTWLIRRIMRVRSQRRYLGWTFGGLWVIGWIFASLLGASLAREFSQGYETAGQEIAVAKNGQSTMTVVSTEPAIRYNGDLFFTDVDNYGWNFTDDSLFLGMVHMVVEPSTDSNYHVLLFKESRGSSFNRAEQLASRIRYNLASRDTLIDIGSGYAIARADKFRGQEVTIEIQVPVGKKLRFDPSVAEKFNRDRVYVNGHRSRRYDRRSSYAWNYRTGVDYTMTKDGELKAEDELKNSDRDDRFEDRRIDSNDSNANRVEDSLQRIRLRQQYIRDSINRELERTEERLDGRQGFVPARKEDKGNFELLGSIFLG